ncbi:MAG: elongation factor P [Candidatus Moraniibacteriota bacterium]
MLSLTDIKTGRRLLWNSEPYLVVEYQHTFLGRGSAVMRTKLKNLLSGAIIDYTFHDKDKIDEAEMGKTKAQYLYHEGEEYSFMDMATFDQFTLSKKVLGNMTDYLIEGTEVTLLNWDEKPLSVELPIKMTLTVTDAPPGIKGDTASGGDKMVTLETGLQVTTPLFIKTGDKLVINTEKGTYVSRASN